MTKQTKRPSMKDVAKLAGVSRTTVSFVVNNSADASSIPPETKEKVWQAVRELGYRPNITAQNLRAQRSTTIGFISDQVATTPFAGQMIQGAQDAAWAHGMLLLLVNTNSDPAMEQAAVDNLLGHQVHGIIYATMFHHEVKPPRGLYETQSVLLDCFAADGTLSSVVPDELQGGQTAVETLIKKGHKRIGFINNSASIPARYGREKGYRTALETSGIEVDEKLVQSVDTDNVEEIRQTVYPLLELSDPPTAIFCFNDHVAREVYQVLRQLDLRIPDDVAVVGFDNNEIISAYLNPGLTTIQLPHYQMGKWAVDKLISGPDEIAHYQMACPLIARESA